MISATQECPQDKQGDYTGQSFHPFTLGEHDDIQAVYGGTYRCRRAVSDNPSVATLAVVVTYHFLFFTHTVDVSSSYVSVGPSNIYSGCLA